jgi:outer membrane murein-binding lipoprotein Lpp
MTRGSKAMIVVLVASLGLWGCAQSPSAQAERVRALEAKAAKLEEDYKAVAAARDQARKQAAALEAEKGTLAVAKAALGKERDELRHQVEARTSERDLAQTRCDRMKKGLQNLLGQDEALLTPPAGPSLPPPSASTTLSASEPPAPGKL